MSQSTSEDKAMLSSDDEDEVLMNRRRSLKTCVVDSDDSSGDELSLNKTPSAELGESNSVTERSHDSEDDGDLDRPVVKSRIKNSDSSSESDSDNKMVMKISFVYSL